MWHPELIDIWWFQSAATLPERHGAIRRVVCGVLSLIICNSVLVYTLAPRRCYLTLFGSFALLQSNDLQVKVQGQNKSMMATCMLVSSPCPLSCSSPSYVDTLALYSCAHWSKRNVRTRQMFFQQAKITKTYFFFYNCLLWYLVDCRMCSLP